MQMLQCTHCGEEAIPKQSAVCPKCRWKLSENSVPVPYFKQDLQRLSGKAYTRLKDALAEERKSGTEGEEQGSVIITMGNEIPGKTICALAGPFCGEGSAGSGMVAQTFGDFADLAGTHSNAFEKKMAYARQRAYTNLARSAHDRNIDGVIGLRYQFVAISNDMILCSCQGTGVMFEKEQS